jgi:8-oxo-dGTP diphosphatase
VTVLLVRHAVAKARHSWDEDDDLRPLTSRGRAQALALADVLAAYTFKQVLSSPSVRCVETVSSLGLPVEVEEALAEGNGRKAARFVRGLLESDADVVLCSHGDVIPEVLNALGFSAPRCAKGSTWVLDGRHATYLPPPE